MFNRKYTDSFMVEFSIVMLVFEGGLVSKGVEFQLYICPWGFLVSEASCKLFKSIYPKLY